MLIMKKKYKITYDLYKIWNGRKPKLTNKQLKFYKNKYFITFKCSFAPALFRKCLKQKIYDDNQAVIRDMLINSLMRAKAKNRATIMSLKFLDLTFNIFVFSSHESVGANDSTKLCSYTVKFAPIP